MSSPPSTSPPDSIVFHPHAVEVIERPEGYREFRCLPATWSYAEPRPLASLLTELYSQRMDTDPHGTSQTAEFWSGSDTALRLRALPADDLAMRELAVLATRRETGLNAPQPWASAAEIEELAFAWEPEATDIHSAHRIPEDDAKSLWEHYGMTDSHDMPIISAYGLRKSVRPPLGRAVTAWAGGGGTWYSWSAIRAWERWPRRQEAQSQTTSANAGKLLLFISHRWESLDHPDPSGAQLTSVDVGLDLALAAALLQRAQEAAPQKTVSGLPEVFAAFLAAVFEPDFTASASLQRWAKSIRAAASKSRDEATFRGAARKLEKPAVKALLARVRERVLVWYDYASMFQAPRTEIEEKHFRREMLELNDIQARGATVVIAGDTGYVSRAWCFLELSGGIRSGIVELTPSWGQRVGVGSQVTEWASRTDQLIGALHLLGDVAIQRSGLDATHAEDLAPIARLLGGLTATGLLATDDSDLIGGSIPAPFREGAWIRKSGAGDAAPQVERTLTPLPDAGRLPERDSLRDAEDVGGHALAGRVGVWVYSTQKALALAWSARAAEAWRALRGLLASACSAEELSRPLADALHSVDDVSVSCMWADARALADDGLGWTRIIPSAVDVLVIVAPADVPELCLIYQRVVDDHVACGVPVVMYAPETGRTLVYRGDNSGSRAQSFRADVLAVPRLRRSYAYPRRMMVSTHSTSEDLEVLAALRLDPAEDFVRPGTVVEQVAEAGFGEAGAAITVEQLLGHSEARVRAEARARSTTASWDTWCTPRLHRSAWEIGFAPLQLHVIDQLVRKAANVSDNPFLRRKLIYILVKDHEGYGLPPSVLEDADTLIERILKQREGG